MPKDNQDLFAATGSTARAYTAKDIEVLEGLEPVRRRPGMYIGGTDAHAMHHLAAEILDNAMDEAVAGHASRIEMELAAGNVLHRIGADVRASRQRRLAALLQFGSMLIGHRRFLS